MKASDVDPALLMKYQMMTSDCDRWAFMREVLLDPTLASIEIEDCYRSIVTDRHRDRYVTVPRLPSHELPSPIILNDMHAGTRSR